uniref:Neurotransmitter-gated ion-channel ligand-binding domain-containing protein n=1 Tax=Glossina brevipalpis TaxID=37001 RepID=A0A1A9WIU0_9MUSC
MCINFKNYFSGLVIVIFLSLVQGDFKYNVSLSQMETCKHYAIPATRGYVYTDFFHVRTMNNNKLAANELLHLKFYVMTARDAHILLSVTDHPRLLDRVYEIVIGAGRNKFSTIRTSIGRRRVATDMEANILSVFDPTPIEIVQTKGEEMSYCCYFNSYMIQTISLDAELLVYIPGLRSTPLMNFTDMAPLSLNYISFTTYDNEPASWFYDCRFDGFATELDDDVKWLTPEKRLLLNIVEKAENASMPVNLKEINFSFQIRAIHYKHDQSLLKTRLNMRINWYDSRLQWDPVDFNDMNRYSGKDIKIWLPQFVVVNAALNTRRRFNPPYQLFIENNGTITLLINDAVMYTWCPNPLQNWPNELLNCELALGVSSENLQRLKLVYDRESPLSKTPISTLTEWSFKQISVTNIENSVLARYTKAGIIQSRNGDVSVMFEIIRNSNFYQNVFIMPIVACQILLILSFLLRGYRRGGLILVVVLILMLGLMFITKHAPSAYVPDILYAYQHIIRVAATCYILHIVIIWMELYPPKIKPCNWLLKILTYSPLRLMLCMRLSDAREYIDVQTQPWREVAKMLNSFVFLIINIVFILVDVILLPQA